MANTNREQADENQASVPYFVHEVTMARMERIFRITVIALVVALMISAIAFLVNDSLWRRYCTQLEEKYNAGNPELHEQSDHTSD